MKAIVSFYDQDGSASAYSRLRNARSIKILGDRSAIYMVPENLVAQSDGTFTFEVEGKTVNRHDLISEPLTVGLVRIIDGEVEEDHRKLRKLVGWGIVFTVALALWFLVRGCG